MQIDGQASADTGASSGGGSEGLTAAELAYLNSGGRDTAALEAEWGNAGQGGSQESGNNSQASSEGSGNNDASGAENGDGDEFEDTDTLVTMGPDGKPRGKDGKFVPHKAFHAVREKYKSTRDELQSVRVEKARAEERIAVFTDLLSKSLGAEGQQQATQEQQDEPAPDPEKDIFGFVKWQAKQIEKLQTRLEQTTQKTDARDAEAQFRSTYISDATKFLEKTPDFRDAYSHLVKGRDAELEAVGMTDPAARKAHIAKEEKALVQQALQNGASPSQVLYNLAKARGYAPAAPKPQQSDAVKKIEQIASGQKAAGNPLSSAGGSSGEGLTVEAFLNMSEGEYAAAMAKLTPAQKRQLLGG